MISQKCAVVDSIIQKQLLPKEELMKLSVRNMSLKIGLPSTIQQGDARIPLTPQGVELLINNGHEVLIESGAGLRASFSDRDYAECGATICSSREEVFMSDVLLMMSPIDEEDISLLRGRQLLFSPLYISLRNEVYLRKLMAKRMTCIAFEFLQDEEGIFPISQILSEIMGSVAINVACEQLSNTQNGRGVFLGGITGLSPAEVTIMGSGTIAEFAARTAIGMGATVKIFDDSVTKLRKLQERLGHRVFSSMFYPQALRKALKSADAVIGALPMEKPLNLLIPEEMVEQMKPGSVIIDLNIIQGGCFETSHLTCLNKPTYEEHNVIHYCVPNITARVSRTTSIALSNINASLMLEIALSGSFENHIRNHKGFQAGIYLYNGILTNKMVSERLMIPYKDIQLLLAAF